ncbi:hypothetical protein AUJ42_00085 [Candidatus Collierbacteria bacterium CG1_02_44_10]|uniref:Uncharacterized protein n=4 Tax=Candidatus Collieribacteriota TaxID=1752725 RepID=A0A2H0DTH3_9BACT|nr:hypothetical protein [bacterium]OIN92823.1 MAG: hypothetical protein AUJ42_00085 [Candidatus Collierbacteria bacterium CG1_02_44_10]PIP85483.1 MAG: hypothetical protein COW83_04025 [Candidatus Collierbacteria bacterium CG22_combo_CG10-13_8_21_14_all_43_12]PIR99981.1 MAG: hypothetical protein COT86_01045 [Candidatus Collierbacteria bacterium CG10_big_fil_rev_8_21_14_0_10_43_36]PIZ24473.1 MAG: hypothetical protein COY48_02690 [Candidatus Collierbacteria bacterium CG_4_10_14_0_8_um_filter_43_86
MNPLQTFLQKLDSIHSALDFTEGTDGVKADLLASINLDLISKIAADPKNKTLLEDLASHNPATKSDVETSLAYATEKMKDAGIDVNALFTEVANWTLQNYLSKLAVSFPPEQIDPLRALI